MEASTILVPGVIFMATDPYGFLGIILILIAWLPETVKNLKAMEITTRIEFLILYTVGSILLTIHAYILGDIIFIILNAIAAMLSGANMLMKIHNMYSKRKMNEG